MSTLFVGLLVGSVVYALCRWRRRRARGHVVAPPLVPTRKDLSRFVYIPPDLRDFSCKPVEDVVRAALRYKDDEAWLRKQLDDLGAP